MYMYVYTCIRTCAGILSVNIILKMIVYVPSFPACQAPGLPIAIWLKGTLCMSVCLSVCQSVSCHSLHIFMLQMQNSSVNSE
jgi:hypothetical protein